MILSLLVFICTRFCVRVVADNPSTASFPTWSGWGANFYNNRWASENSDISASSINSLTSHCIVSYPNGVSATPVVLGDTAYYPTWNGSFVAFDYITCQVLWEISVTDIVTNFAPISQLQTNVSFPMSRTSPQIDGDVLFFGTLIHALVVAVNRLTGQTLGVIQINSHPVAIVTQSPTFYNGVLFVGSSSIEEDAALEPGYVCCSFVGNMLALSFDPSAGKFSVLWDIPMIPKYQAEAGWSGASVWGSQPSIDTNRGQVFIATGNTYSIPAVIIECQTATQNVTAVVEGLVPDPCLPRDIWQESVLAIDIELGIVNWVNQIPALDAFTLACGLSPFLPRNPVSCPQTPGPDADFGMAPAFVPGSRSTPHGKDTLVVGQKNGNLYAMSAEAGELFWATATSPGGAFGGLGWGIAVDDSQVYFTAINSMEKTWQLEPSGQAVIRSAYGAASLSNGSLLWETGSPLNGVAYGPPAVVGDVVLVARTGFDPNQTLTYDSTNGSLIVIQKATGNILTAIGLSSNFHGGIAVQGQDIMFGTGYSPSFSPQSNGAFEVMRVVG